MRKIAAVVLLAASVAVAAPTVLGAIIRLERFANLAAFPAADALNEGGLGYDTNANTVRVSNGSNWTSISVDNQTLAAVYVNLALTAGTTVSGMVLPPSEGFVVNATSFRIRTAGTGGTTNAVFRISDGANNCDASFACNSAVGNYRVTTTGSCSFAASASLTFSVFSIGDCVTGPDIQGNALVNGAWQ